MWCRCIPDDDEDAAIIEGKCYLVDVLRQRGTNACHRCQAPADEGEGPEAASEEQASKSDQDGRGSGLTCRSVHITVVMIYGTYVRC